MYLSSDFLRDVRFLLQKLCVKVVQVKTDFLPPDAGPHTYTAGYTTITCCNIAQIMTSVKLSKAISLYWFCFSVCCGLIDHSVM